MPDGTANSNRMNAQAASSRKRRRSLGAMALEPRLMYDAAAVTTTANIWFTTNHTVGNTNQAATAIEQIGVDGSSLATAPVDVNDGAKSVGELTSLAGVAVDAARQKFFVVDKNTSGNWVILSGSTATGALDATPVYTLAAGNGASISGLQIDAQTGELYFAQSVHDSTGKFNNPSETGIFMISESATNLTPANTAQVTQVVSLPGTELDAPKNFALDFKDNLVFFTDSSGQGTGIDKLGIASLSPGGNGTLTFFQASSLPGVAVNTNNGQLSGIAVDPSRDMLYFTTDDTSHQDQNYVFSSHFTVSGSGNTATATLDTSTINHITLGSSGAPTAIALDVPDGLFYVTNLTASPDASPRPSGNIQVGSLDQAGNVVSSQPLTTVFDASTLQDASGQAVGLTNPINLFIETTPTVSAGDSVTFTQNGPAVTADAGLAAVDSSGQDFTGATVTISGGAWDGDTLTADTSNTNIAWSYDSASHTLTLSGVDTAANYQRVLESVTFSSNSADPTNGGTDAERTLSWSVTDGLLTSNTATSTVEIHRAPIVTAGDTATFFGGGAPVALDGTLSVSDPDGSGTLSSATVAISGGLIANQDTLNFTDQNGITGRYDASTGTLTLTGTATVANYQTALDSITYSFNPTNGDPTAGNSDTTRTITWVVNGAAPSNAVTSTVDTVHVAPTVVAGDTVTFGAGGAPVTLDGALTVSDPDSNDTLASATVTISSGFVQGDTLAADTTGTSLTSSYDSTTHTLTLSGNDTLAHYQQLLKTVAFGSTNADPTNGGADPQRTLTWTAFDGVLSSKDATSTVMVDMPPTVVAGDSATFFGGGNPVTLDGALAVSDVDSSTLSGTTVSISSGFVQGDTLNFAGLNGITGTYDDVNGILKLTGAASVTDYQAALKSITYSFNPANGDPTGGGGNTTRTITWVADDGFAKSNPVTSTLDTVHVAPTVDAGNATATFTGGGPAVVLDGALTVADPDSGGNLASATVTISSGFVQGDALAADTTGTNLTWSYDSTNHTLTLSGNDTLAHYQNALRSVTYNFPGNGDPTQGGSTTRTISWVVSDGVAQSSSATSTLSTVNAIHTAPTLSGAGNTTPYAKHDPGVTIDGRLTVTDPDSGNNLIGATVTISSGFASGDTLAVVTSGTNIAASYNANTGVLTLTGQDTLANYQTVLDHVTYSSTSNDPSQGNKDTTRTITWIVDDGATSHNLSTPVTSTIDIVPELQSIAHPPHGPHAFSLQTPTLTMSSLSGDDRMVTRVGLASDPDADQDSIVVPWPAGRDQRADHDTHAAVDLRHAVVATDAELLAARRGQAGGEGRHLGEGDKPAHGKPGLLAQLKAAGRHGLVHERQALIKDLHKRSAAR